MIEINNRTKSKIDIRLVKKVADSFLVSYKMQNKNLSIAFIGDTVMRRLNMLYRGKNKPTDILSFSGQGTDLGEIIIDYAQIKRQAPKYSRSIRAELVFIMVHGLLHLLGYDDETEAGRLKMIRLGEKFIARNL